MIGKRLLPQLGAAPAVWNTCLLFFQAVLLAGYAYAHGAAAWLSLRRRLALHAALVLFRWRSLPVAGVASAPPARANPTAWLLQELARSIGLPFFVLSASAPVLQSWFSGTTHPRAPSPWFLFAASNVGSLLALVAYPTLVEPLLPLRAQGVLWSSAYGVYAVLVLGCALWTLAGPRVPPRRTPRRRERTPRARRGPAAQVARWIALSAVPSSLTLGVTTYLATDVASLPLLWVVPLSLYLLTFVAAFSRVSVAATRAADRLLPMQVLLVAMLTIGGLAIPLGLSVLLHLLLFTAAALVCHGQLAQSRPAVEHLTGYYLAIAFGGMLGGACERTRRPGGVRRRRRVPARDRAGVRAAPGAGRADGAVLPPGPSTAALPLAGRSAHARGRALGQPRGSRPAPARGARSPCRCSSPTSSRAGRCAFAVARRPDAAGGLAGPGTLRPGRPRRAHLLRRLPRARGPRAPSPRADARHDTSRHAEPRPGAPATSRWPTTTAAARSGRRSRRCRRRPAPEVAVVGLGAGALASYARPGQRWTFFEIDPAVERIARDTRWFSYLADCGERCSVVTGDARLSLARAPERRLRPPRARRLQLGRDPGPPRHERGLRALLLAPGRRGSHPRPLLQPPPRARAGAGPRGARARAGRARAGRSGRAGGGVRQAAVRVDGDGARRARRRAADRRPALGARRHGLAGPRCGPTTSRMSPACLRFDSPSRPR